MTQPIERRQVLAIAGTSLVSSLAGCLDVFPPGTSNPEWPMLGHDARNTGYNPTASGPRNSVTTRWTYDTGSRIMAAPVVADQTVYIGDLDNRLYALDAQTGRLQWKHEGGEKVSTHRR